jgi:hypothetical protein
MSKVNWPIVGTPYTLRADQKRQVIQLLKPSEEKAAIVLEELEQLVGIDGWLDFDPNGGVMRNKVVDRRIRNLTSVSKSLKALASQLAKVDPIVLGFLNDQFSYIQMEMVQQIHKEKNTKRTILPLAKVMAKLSSWADFSASELADGGSGKYLERFLFLLEEFLRFRMAIDEARIDLILYKLTSILCDIDEETAKKQVIRWNESK